MEDDGFVSHMFNIKVVSKDGTISTTYKDFLTKYKKTERFVILEY